MTNEEAITRIRMMLKLNNLKYADDIEALLMAIESLKGEALVEIMKKEEE